MTIKASNFPTTRPSLDLNFAQTKRLDPRVTFSRASTATYTDANGVIQTAASGTPRFDHNPTTGESLGLLVEESRTNLITYSQAFNSTNYNTGYDGGAFTENATTAPDGTLTASKLTRNTGTSGCWWAKYNIQHINVASGTVYTISCYLKAAELSTVTIVGDIRDAGGLPHNAAFTLTGNGSYVLNGGSSAQITPVGNGWYRCSVTGTASTTDTEEPGLVVYGTGTSGQGFYAWGFQLEAGAFPTSYIPTPATFTSRASTATYYDANGVIQTAAINVARSNAFLPDSNGVMRPAGLLLEAAGTNLITDSSFPADRQVIGISTSTVSSILRPDGTTGNVKAFTVDNAAASPYPFFRCGYSNTASNVLHTGSVWIRAASGSHTISFSMGTASGPDATANTTITTAWKRLQYTRLPWSGNEIFLDFYTLATANGTTFYIWGAQIETGSYATSLIPTSGSTVTRAADVSTSSTVTRSADVASITGTNFSSWYRQDEGTMFTQARFDFSTTTSSVFPAVYETGSYPNRLWVLYNNGTLNQLTVGADAFSGPFQAFTSSPQTFKVAQALSNTSLTYSASKDGSAPLTGSMSKAIVSTTSMLIGSGNGAVQRISRLTYWPTRLSNATLQTITT